MKSSPKIIFAIFMAFSVLQVSAQNKGSNTLQQPPKDIKVDGNLADWGDSLRYHNEEKKLNYSLANDKENLYVAMRINDHSEQMRVLNSGLTLSINPKGKKNEMFTITFPVGGNDTRTALENLAANNPGAADDHDEMMRARVTKLRNIKVTGFADIESDMMTTANTYGIQVAISYNEDGYLDYEAAIPLKFFHADDPGKSEWAFNFKINGITRASGHEGNPGGSDNQMAGGRGGMGGGRGGMGGGRGGMGGGRGSMRGGGMQGGSQSADRSEMGKSIDFWEKFYLSPGN